MDLENIKSYRENELRNYVLANLLIIIMFTDSLKQIYLSDNDLTISILKTISFTFLSSIIYIFVFIIDGLIPSNYKDRLIFIKKNRLPGFTVFTDIKTNKISDIRFSNDKILEIHNKIYKDLDSKKFTVSEKKKFENEKWYELYIENKNNEMIITSQRDYLLTRDIYISTISIIVLYLFFSRVINSINFEWPILIYFLVMICVTNIVTRIKVKKFVLNVLALSVYKKESRK